MITGELFLLFFRIQFLLLCTACLFTNSGTTQCISSFPNTQKFDITNGGWITGGNASDWAWGTPNKPVINAAASGTKCWISGGLNNNSYNNNELSWVKSPCYNLSTLKYPTVGVKVFWESEYGNDGTVLQYSTDNGNNWYDVGSYSDAKNCFNLNWFNTGNINSLGGGGWSGSLGSGGGCGSGNGSNKWTLVSHTMPYLAGKTSVQFRFLFGAGPNCNDYDGFAFDDFTIGDALPNFASFVYTCSGGNTVNFSGSGLFCPTLTWDFGDRGSGAANVSNVSNPAHTFSGAGQFTVKLTATGPDNAPSTVTKVITILDLNTQILNEPSCNGDMNGSVMVTATPNVAGLNYSWNTSPVQLTASAVNLGKGTYVVTVTGPNICQSQNTITIDEPAILSSTTITDQPTCNTNDGKITLGTTGGTAPYTYTWTPNISGTNIAAGLTAGDYSVIVKDKNQCTETRSFSLSAPAGLTAIITAKKDVTCNGGKNGSATVTVSGGSGPYTYAWSPSGGTDASATALNGDTYLVTIKDQAGCSTSATTIITEPAALKSAMSTTDALCGNNNGTAAATVTGGVAPYNYLWSPGGYNTATVGSLAPNDYTLTVTDKNGCQVTDVASIKATGTTISLQINHADIKCFGDKTGTATVVINGGVAPFTITWSNGATGATASNLTRGKYTVTVKDAAGCSSTASVDISEPAAALKAVLNVTDALCNNGKGSIKSTVTGGALNYQYAWSNGSTAADLNNAAAATYTLNITDNNGCKTTAGATIKEPAALAVNVKVQATTCGNNNGSATAIVSGGSAPYAYTWSPGNMNTASINNVAAAKYALTVTDKNGCTQPAAADIISSTAINLQINHADVKCFGDKTGSATVVINGGIAPFTITWSNGATGATASNLTRGKYTVTVKDAAGCSNSASVDIMEPAAALNVVLEVTDALCKNAPGRIISTTTGGTVPYQYAWTPAFGNVASLINVPAGTYALNLTDNNGCKATASGTIKEPIGIVTKLTIQNAACNNNNGSINTAVSGGLAPYIYSWLPGNQTTAAISNLASGRYTLTVTDKNGCIANDTGIVTTPGNLFVQTSTTNINCSGDKNGSATVSITGGSPSYSIAWSNGLSTPAISNLSKGNYTVTVKDATGCSSTKTFEISEPAPLTVLLDSVSAVCNNANGSIYTNTTGGILPYSYSWLPANTNSPAILNLLPGMYSVTVTDKNGCKTTASATVKNTNPLSISLGADTTICGTDKVRLSPGNFISYSWQDGSNASFYDATQQGSYWVTVQDLQGCIASDSIRIVASCGEIWFPAAFTPNGDGKNETFGPLGNFSQISDYSMTVFNRWGEKVFESYNPAAKWNGKFKGTLIMGTYVWFARFSDRTGLKTVRKGTIVLVL